MGLLVYSFYLGLLCGSKITRKTGSGVGHSETVAKELYLFSNPQSGLNEITHIHVYTKSTILALMVMQ